jgi:hypothetical protein
MTLVFEGVNYFDLINNQLSFKEEVTSVQETNFKKKYFYFFDVYKQKSKLVINMVDYLNGALPLSTTKLCWWCRDSFTNSPIGIPLSYYQSNNKSKEIFKRLNLDYSKGTEYFETDGIFCSFPCAKSYIVDEKLNSRYKNSTTLLSLLYKKINNKIDEIPFAPSWKLLKKFGGELTITEFRKSFGDFQYIDSYNVKKPFIFSIGNLYIEK